MAEMFRRYIMVPVIIYENDIIPIWDEKLKYEKHPLYGKGLWDEENGKHHIMYTEAVYDIKKRKIIKGIIIDCYPDEHLEFAINDEVYRDVDRKGLKKDKVKDIIFKEYEDTIYKGSKLIDSYKTDKFGDVTIDPYQMYCLRNWKPFWVMESDGEIIEWAHQLYKKYKE